jgi:membrane protein implicated in regulation of membrane protease activity
MDWKMTIIWLVLMLVLAFLEAATTQLVTIWFALGALVAMLASIFHAPLWLQVVLFAVVSAAALVLTRPLAKKLTKATKVPTNADRVIGRTGVVQDAVNNETAVGTILVDGAVWSARSADGSQIPSGARVTVERIEGVKCIVSVEGKE